MYAVLQPTRLIRFYYAGTAVFLLLPVGRLGRVSGMDARYSRNSENFTTFRDI